MLLSRRLDDKEIQLKNQSQIFFQISGAGHEAVLVAAGLTLQAGLRLVLSRTTAIARCACSSASRRSRCCSPRSARRTIPSSGGRQMPSHWGHTALTSSRARARPARRCCTRSARRKPASSTAASPQIPDRDARFHADEIVYVSLGEGATSEGEFWEALNAACTQAAAGAVPGRGQRLRDLGAGRSADRRAATSRAWCDRFPGLHVDSIDGTDFLASLRAMREAAAYVRARKGPALVHAHVIRPYSHSLSDDEKLYKTPAEREAEARRDPIARFAEFLQDATASPPTTDLAAIAADVEREIDEAAQQALARAEAGQETPPRSGSTRPTSIRPRPRSTRRRSPKASPTRWSPRSTAR